MGTFLVRSVDSKKIFELIPTVEMETSEFPATCNHCRNKVLLFSLGLGRYLSNQSIGINSY